MKYLFVDDMPKYLKIHVNALRDAGHVVEIACDLSTAWKWIGDERKTDNPFDLVLIDLGLDRKVMEFKKEDEELRDALLSKGYGDLPISGQALGLRLWRRRNALQQPYCYFTNHLQLWLENFDKEDPEFGGETLEGLRDLMLDKSDLWPGNIKEKFWRARQVWKDEQWL